MKRNIRYFKSRAAMGLLSVALGASFGFSLQADAAPSDKRLNCLSKSLYDAYAKEDPREDMEFNAIFVDLRNNVLKLVHVLKGESLEDVLAAQEKGERAEIVLDNFASLYDESGLYGIRVNSRSTREELTLLHKETTSDHQKVWYLDYLRRSDSTEEIEVRIEDDVICTEGY